MHQSLLLSKLTARRDPSRNQPELTLFKKRHSFMWSRLAVLTVAHSHAYRRILTPSLEIRETAYNLLASLGSHRPPAKTMRPSEWLRPVPPIAPPRKRTEGIARGAFSTRTNRSSEFARCSFEEPDGRLRRVLMNQSFAIEQGKAIPRAMLLRVASAW